MTPVLEGRSLVKSFVASRNLAGRPIRWVRAVKDVSVHVDAGETLGVLGETGAGKSSVGRLLVDLYKPDSGTVLLDGVALQTLSKAQRRATKAKARMVFQDPFTSLNPRMSVGDLVAEPLRLQADLDRAGRSARVARAFDSIGLRAEDMRRYPGEFSGGQLQRVAVARAIVTDPAVVVCDEPVASLDTSMRAQIINLLRDLQQQREIALVFISHDLSLVELIAQRVVVMYRGRIVEAGDAAVLSRPQHPYTRALVEAVPIPKPGRRRREAKANTARDVGEAQQDMPGCDYADRCPLVTDICRVERPLLQATPVGEVACHLIDVDNSTNGGGPHDSVRRR